MARALRVWAIKGRKKTRSIICRTDRANDANKRYILPQSDDFKSPGAHQAWHHEQAQFDWQLPRWKNFTCYTSPQVVLKPWPWGYQDILGGRIYTSAMLQTIRGSRIWRPTCWRRRLEQGNHRRHDETGKFRFVTLFITPFPPTHKHTHIPPPQQNILCYSTNYFI